ncbi:MAG: S1 family peptidase [Bryobacteraceae bacterium]|nr:S1 family peptidase [Bryobacteraceae bacterium]
MRYFALLLLATAPSFGIIIQSNVSGFTTGASAFTGVVAIHSNSGLCSGSLIAADLILTAGHCVSGASSWQVTFSTPGSGVTIAASQSYLHPEYGPRPSPVGNLPEYDVAILRLSVNAPTDATIYGIKRDYGGITSTGLPGATWVDIVGYGRFGLGGQVPSLNFSNPVRHWARNTIDGYLTTLSGASTPDEPLLISATFNIAAADEGLVNGGDSGGPMLFGNQIVGVASAGDLPRTTTVATNVEYSNIHANLVDDLTGEWVESFLVPEPGTVLLCAAGLLVVFVGRRTGSVRHNN